MKKFFSLVLLSLTVLLVMPLNAFADTTTRSLTYNRVDNGDGTYTVTVNLTTADDDPITTATVTLTEQGGAEITSIDEISSGSFSIMSDDETSDGVYTVELISSTDVSGTNKLFTFTYKASGTTDCKVKISLGTTSVTVEDEPDDTDDTTDNVETGSTLPYIALGGIVVVAGIAYVATRNKSKMYKI